MRSNNNRLIIYGAALVATVLLGGALLPAAKVMAGYGNAGNGGTPGGTNPTNCSTQTVGSCHGGGWTYHYLNGADGVTIAGMSGTGYSFPGGTISGCSNTDGYWRSAWFRNGGSDDASLVGIARNDVWQGMGGWHTYNAAATPLATVQQEFAKARDIDHVVPAGVDWSSVGWFCANSPGEIETSGESSFKAKSAIEVAGDGASHVPSIPKQVSDWNGKVYATFSTDSDTAKVKFSHIMDYTNNNVAWTELGHGHDIVNSPTSNWTVTSGGSGGGGSGGYSPNARIAVGSSAGESTQYEKEVTISVPLGGKVTVCSKINYNTDVSFNTTTTPATWSYNSTTGTYTQTHEAYRTWNPSAATGDASSEACVEVYHPKDPDGYVWTLEQGSGYGTGSTAPMFAGESSFVGWDVSGTHYPTRRLEGYKAVVFNYAPTRGYDGGAGVNANLRTTVDPCGYFNARQAQNCRVIDNIEKSGYNASHTLNESRKVVVPDTVGAKYCTAFGYHYESYYGTRQGDSGDYSWTATGYNYWYDFNASCHTIAKRPSLSFWNGSLMSTSPVITSLSPRFNNPVMGNLANDSDPAKLYGPWSEYLAAVNAAMNKDRTVSSGSNLSNGRDVSFNASYKLCDSASTPWTTNSSLTIANTACNVEAGNIGHSGIQANSTLKVRLDAYLKNQPTTLPLGSSYAGETNVSGNKIYKTSGDLEITGNITISDTTGYTIHNVPQVVIFVNGNLKISSNVSRIDAWLIVSGNIETCPEFVKSNGVANPSDTRADAGSSSNTCGGQLVFNGPVIMNGKLTPRRSFGADPSVARTGLQTNGATAQSAKQSSAEVFNLRADTYLWAYAQAARYKSSYQEVYARELAPRY